MYALHLRRTRVGRSRDVDVTIHDRAAARQHFVLDWREDVQRHQVTVWGINGLLVNGATLLRAYEERILEPGDEVRIGDTILCYQASK